MMHMNNFVYIIVVILFTVNAQVFQCGDDADIFILLDDSETTKFSIASKNQLYPPGVINFVTQVLMSPVFGDVMFAVSLVSNTVRDVANFTNDVGVFTPLTTFTPELKALNADMGFIRMRQRFSELGRPGVNRYGLYIASTLSDRPQVAIYQAAAAAADGIIIIGVSFGGSLPEAELEFITNNVTRVFLSPNAESLTSLLPQLIPTCPDSTTATTAPINTPITTSTTTPTATSTTIPNIIPDLASTTLTPSTENVCVNAFADVALIVDDSDSTKRLTADENDVMYSPYITDFMKQLVERVTSGDVRVSITMFSSTARIIASFTSDNATLFNTIDKITPEFSGTKPWIPLMVSQSLFSAHHRPGAKKFVVVLIDSKTDDVLTTQQQKQKAIYDGIKLVSIGFGLTSQYAKSDDIASQPDYAFTVPSDVMLNSLITDVSTIICQN